MSTMLQWAQRYLALGYHPVPVPPGTKRPAIKWERYQDIAPTAEELEQWWSENSNFGIALVMGRGTFAVDLDGGDIAERMLTDAGVSLPSGAPRSKTGGGGFHVLLKGTVPDKVQLLKDETQAHCGVDIKGKGIILVPPTVHPNGTRYAWVVPPFAPSLLPDIPPDLHTLIATAQPAPDAHASTAPGVSWVATAMAGVREGGRADMCVRLAGYFLGKGLTPDVVTALLSSGFAANCHPPFPPRDVADTVANIAKREATVGDAAETFNPVHVSAIISELEQQRLAGPTPCIPLVFHELDWSLNGGFHGGELIYLGAKPGVGKTALALQMAGHAARNRHPVVVVSREMVNVSLMRRMVSQESGVPSRYLRGDQMSESMQLDYDAARRRVSDYPLWLTDKCGSVTDVCRLVERCDELSQRTGKLGMLVIDYLQLVRAPKDVKERRLQVEAVSQQLKAITLQYQIPVLCLSSLSRPGQMQRDAKPTLASLRESGELEHDADVVMFLHKPTDGNEVTLIVAKNRDGSIGSLELLFYPDILTFQTRGRPMM